MHYVGKKSKPNVYTIAPSDALSFTYSPELALRGAVLYEASGYTRMPTLEDVTNINPQWERDIMTVLDYLKWIRNSGNEVPRLNQWQA